MWPFTRRPLLEVTNESYTLWLRAQRPPWLWFLELDKHAQEHIALLGDEDRQDFAIAIGYAVQDPKLADAGLSASDDLDSEEVLATRVATNLMDTLRQRGQEAPRTASVKAMESLAGFGERRVRAAQRAVKTGDKDARFFGRRPDKTPQQEGTATSQQGTVTSQQGTATSQQGTATSQQGTATSQQEGTATSPMEESA